MIFDKRKIHGMSVEVVTVAELEKIVCGGTKVHYDYEEFIESINLLIEDHAKNLDAMPELIGFDLSSESGLCNDDACFPLKLHGDPSIDHEDGSIEWVSWNAWPIFRMWTEPTPHHGPTLIYEIVRVV